MKILEIVTKQETPSRIPVWPSSHAEMRHKLTQTDELINEIEIDDPDEKRKRSLFMNKVFYNKHPERFNNDGAEVNGIHYHTKVKPKNLNNTSAKFLRNYTTSSSDEDDEPDFSGGIASSSNLNFYLRNRFAGDDLTHPAKQLGFIQDRANSRDEAKILKTIERFDQLFADKKNTNRMKLHVFCGIPENVGKFLDQSPNRSMHTLPSFTSTSTNFFTALGFARMYPTSRWSPPHIIHFTLTPGSGITVANISEYPEHEILLKYGTQFRYDGSYTHTTIYRDDVRIHDAVVFPINDRKHPALTVDDYGPYHHPSNTTP